MRVEVIRSFEPLRTIEAKWKDLVNRSHNPTPFQTFEWVYACCEWIEKPDAFFIIAVRDGSRLVGLAPLVFCNDQFGGKSLRFIGAGISDYLTFLTEMGQEETVLRSIMCALWEGQPSWDSIALRDLPGEAVELDTLSTIARAIGFYVAFPHDESECWKLPLPSSWQDYLGKLSSKMSSSMEWQARKLRRDFAIRVEDMAVSGWEDGLHILFDLHQERWGNKGQPGAFAEESIRQFHRQVVAAFRTGGNVSLLVIFADNEPVAAIYLFRMGNVVYYYLSGCRTDAPWNRYSVGRQVVREAILRAIESGATTFDFMRGGGVYKGWFGAKPAPNANVVLFHSRRSYLAYYTLTRGRQFVKTLMPQPLKRVVRKLLSPIR